VDFKRLEFLKLAGLNGGFLDLLSCFQELER